MGKLLIIDGSCLLTTNYYGNLPKTLKYASKATEEEKEKLYKGILKNADGEFTNAVYGFLQYMAKMLNRSEVTHVAVVFDNSREKLDRKKIYPPYKANRKQTPRPLTEQYKTMEKALEDMGFAVFYRDGIEADDFAGTIAKKFEDEISVSFLTKDKDYLQLINEKTTAWMMQSSTQKKEELEDTHGPSKSPWKTYEYDMFVTFNEEGVFPDSIVDLKALSGDSSDNIPGVKGVSSVVPALLQIHGDLEGLYTALDKAVESKQEEKKLKHLWRSNGITRSPYNALTKIYTDNEYVSNAKESAFLSKKLATIRTDVDMDITLDDLKVSLDMDDYKAVLSRLSIKSIERFNRRFFK